MDRSPLFKSYVNGLHETLGYIQALDQEDLPVEQTIRDAIYLFMHGTVARQMLFLEKSIEHYEDVLMQASSVDQHYERLVQERATTKLLLAEIKTVH